MTTVNENAKNNYKNAGFASAEAYQKHLNKLQVQQYYQANNNKFIPYDAIEINGDAVNIGEVEHDTYNRPQQDFLTDDLKVTVDAESGDKKPFLEFLDMLGIDKGSFQVRASGTCDIKKIAEAANTLRQKYSDSEFKIDIHDVSFRNNHNGTPDNLPF